MLKKSAALKIHRKMCIVKGNFSKATIPRTKAYYPAIKEIFAILALPLLSENVAVFASCKP